MLLKMCLCVFKMYFTCYFDPDTMIKDETI